WTYRFFPTEIGVFLLGLLSYRLYRHGSVQGGAWTVVGRHAAAMLIPMVALSQWIPWDRGTATLLTLAVLSLALPYLFTRTKDSAFDRFLGEFSYGIYLGHILVDNFLHTFGFLNGDGPWNSVVVLGVVMGLVWLIRRFTEIPSDRWRHRLTERWLNTLAS
ncbi:MAG TPA: hypothetical protein VNZ67_14640, partial [bacterium]|nr:hypothetical protein [bacterium]